ncbi:basal body-orientation factor 1-like [Amphibalanus amphitrite]|uniref:basal body-orientation factor 1-like n=1 Tax=Amphibalanus amphitrite TaxID=1232801 RepID=UPI001C913769|nr:basal body-orientation factor 1-like [Amphibalanus amphitrite]
MPGKVSALGRKKGPKKGKAGSSRRGKGTKSTKSKGSGSGKKKKKGKKGKRKKGKKRKMISPEEYAEMEQQLKSCQRTNELLTIKLTAMAHSREQYRKCSFSLLDENEHVHKRLIKVERDCIEVVGYLRQKRGANEARLEVVEKELAQIREVESGKRNTLAAEYEYKIKGLNEIISENEIQILRLEYETNKLKGLKEANEKLEETNESLRKELLDTMVRHQNQLVEYEAMILREKRNLEKLARQEVHNLVDTAHQMAAKEISATTADVYGQNYCLNRTLQQYQARVLALEAADAARSRQLDRARTHAETSSAALLQMRRQLTAQQVATQQLRERLAESESDRLQEAVTLQEVRAELLDWAQHERQQEQRQLAQLRRQLALREATVRRLRALARRVLARRSQLEDFFLSALEQVAGAAAGERRQFWRDAEHQYRQQMAAGLAGQAPPPEVMTTDGSQKSSRDIVHDWQRHNEWRADADQVDVSALTWLQKESVLRVLFAHINGAQSRARRQQQQQKKGRWPRKRTVDVGVQKFAQRRSTSGDTSSAYPLLSPYLDKSVQMLGL